MPRIERLFVFVTINLIITISCTLAGPSERARAEVNETKENTFEIDVDQTIGTASLSATIRVHSTGLTYKNEDMENPRTIPWHAVEEVEGKYGGHGKPANPDSPTAYDFLPSLTVRYDLQKISFEKARRFKKKQSLLFTICCTDSKASTLFDEIDTFYYIVIKDR